MLCGKPLSRIWVGAGEDFCSREHRNQYRLRKGMDRLQEANKVATLLRRREQPKPISSALQPGTSDPRLPDSSSIRFQERGKSPAFPSTKWSPPARIPGARGAAETRSSPPAEVPPRDYGILHVQSLQNSGAPRVMLSKGSRQIDPPGADYLERTRRPQSIRVSGRHGSALRVSAGAGFRLPAKRGRHFPTPRHTFAAMRWPDRLMGRGVSSFNRPADSTIVRVKIPPPELPCRLSSVPILDSGMQWPEAIAPDRHLADCNGLTGRSWEAIWSKAEAAMPRPIAPGPQERAAAPLARLPQRLAYGSAAKQIALVPWTAPESPFGYSAPKQGAAERANGTGQSKMEEHFENGFQDWTGGVDDWCVDAAGVRTGSLALFRPSMDMRDYEMEFLARIENQSVTWVFRAANLNDYYIASIGTAPGGGYEFWRGTVTGGIQGSIEAVPLRNSPKGKTAVTVRLRAAGKEFSVWVDGQRIGAWTESRFSSGGIGFIGAPDDRARIYWVRLSPVGSPGKE